MGLWLTHATVQAVPCEATLKMLGARVTLVISLKYKYMPPNYYAIVLNYTARSQNICKWYTR
jgi:hypothetical protein